jgi:hypothetical protein
MITAMVLSLTLLGQFELPGSGLSLEQAKEEAHFILVAEVGKTSGRLGSEEMSVLMWTELKLSAVLKGEVTEEDLNKHPLAIRSVGKEKLPRSGDELIFFVGDIEHEFSIPKILPKTVENLEAIKAVTSPPPARSERGRFGQTVILGGGIKKLEPHRTPPYRGTTIVPEQGTKGEMLLVQNEFAALMKHYDPRPEDRWAHFSWLDKNEFARRYGVRLIGWWGSISGIEPRPGGGWLVKVTMRPWLVTREYVRFSFVNDTVEESYEFVGDRIRLVKSDATEAKPTLQQFPVAF